jgi:hypothetical protein
MWRMRAAGVCVDKASGSGRSHRVVPLLLEGVDAKHRCFIRQQSVWKRAVIRIELVQCRARVAPRQGPARAVQGGNLGGQTR